MAKAMPSTQRRAAGITGAMLVSLALAWVPGCGRTGWPGIETERDDGTGGSASIPAGTEPLPQPVTDASVIAPAPDATTPLDAATAPASAPTTTSTPPVKGPNPCTPTDESCNGKDDDCDGKVDEELAPVPCAAGGAQYCVAGRLSACPTRCEACVPGSERVCFHSYCTYWAVEKCTADGRSFGTCRERTVPTECEDVANRHKDSPELEQCCLDQGYCCRDDHDLDHDGNRGEMLGRCDEVSCVP
jgi:hypothetical protein